MANNIGTIAAKATLDVSPFTKATSNLAATVNNAVSRIQQSFGAMRLNQAMEIFNRFSNLVGNAFRRIEQAAALPGATDEIKEMAAAATQARLPFQALQRQVDSLTVRGVGVISQGLINIAEHVAGSAFITGPANESAAARLQREGAVRDQAIAVQQALRAGRDPIAAMMGGGGQQLATQDHAANLAQMQSEIAMMGRTRNERELLVAQMRGANEVQLNQIRRLQEWRAEIERTTAAQETARRELIAAKPVQSRTRLEDLIAGVTAGTLRPEQLFDRLQSFRSSATSSGGIGSLDAGSTEVAQILQQQRQPQMDMLETLKRIAAEDARRHTEVMDAWREFLTRMVGLKPEWAAVD